MKATLWDGRKQLKGKLIFQEESLVLGLEDFGATSLKFAIKYTEIGSLSYKKLYEIANSAIQITSKKGEETFLLWKKLER